MTSVALFLALSSIQQPISVSYKQLAGLIKTDGGYYPNDEFEHKWRTKSRKTYCVLYAWSGMDSSNTKLTFRSKMKGRWVTTVLDDNSDKGGDYFMKLVEFSDIRAKVELRSKGYAHFSRGSNGKWSQRF